MTLPKTSKTKHKVQVVTIAENCVLLLQFAKDRGEGFQNITGSVEDDESFIEAARREMVEEIGVADNVIDINLSFTFFDRWGSDVLEKVFLYHPAKKPDITISSEHQSYKWKSLQETTKEDFAYPTNFEALKKAMEFCR